MHSILSLISVVSRSNVREQVVDHAPVHTHHQHRIRVQCLAMMSSII